MDDLLEPLREQPTAAAVLCDVDGTLAPIVADPGLAAVPDSTRGVLRELASRYGLVACVTGRRCAEARRIVGVDELVYVGNHGFETARPGEAEPRPDPALDGRERAVAEFMAAQDAEVLTAAGVIREDKGAIHALHWRQAPEPAAAEEMARAVAVAAEAEGLVARPGRMVLELRPSAEIDKGAAAARLVRESGVRAALFGGDDRTDLDAFAALRDLVADGTLAAAVCVGVGSGEEPEGLRRASDMVVDGTEGFRAVLEALR